MNFINRGIRILLVSVFMLSFLQSKEEKKQKIVVRMATHVSVFSPLYGQMKMFSEKIEKQLPGEFHFKLYPSGQLGKEKALISNLKSASIEIINVASGAIKLDKILGLYDLPWLFDDRSHVIRSLDAGLADNTIRILENQRNLKVLGIYENGFRHIINGKRAIHKPRSLRGLKIRISGGKFRQTVFRQMGAIPQKVAWKETFTALQTGVVDGAEAAAYGFYEQKHYEVMKFLSLTGHVYTPSFMLISAKFLHSLSDKQQRTFINTAKSMKKEAFKQAEDLENKYFDIMKAKVEINVPQIEIFQKRTKKSYRKYIKQHGDKLLKIVERAR